MKAAHAHPGQECAFIGRVIVEIPDHDPHPMPHPAMFTPSQGRVRLPFGANGHTPQSARMWRNWQTHWI